MSAIVRRARPQDVDRILDLLTEYDLPRDYFEPFYAADPTYRPEQSWLVEVGGRLAAHLRVFDRAVKVHGAWMRVAGIGNVITAGNFRGQGHAGRLLRTVTREASSEGYIYSLLWTHLPGMYERYAWTPIAHETIYASLPEEIALPPEIGPLRSDDLPDVVRLFEATNAQRSGTMLRSAEYWRAQPSWLHTAPDDALGLRRADGSLAGYIRSRTRRTEVEVLELGARVEEIEVGRRLVTAAARKRSGRVEARLPRSLTSVIPPDTRQAVEDAGLMGRVLDLTGLLQMLRPVLQQRVELAGAGDDAVSVLTAAGAAELRISKGRLTISAAEVDHTRALLNENDLAHLLFHGYDPERFGDRSDAAMLQALFPTQDFVIWPADAF